MNPTTEHPTADRSMRNASITAGAGLLLMAVLSVFGSLVAVEGLVTPGDAARTAADISASQGLFQLGIVALYSVIVLDVVVAWGLYRVFRPVSSGISMLAAWFRLAYAGVFMVAISRLAGVPLLLGSDDHFSAFSTDQLHARVLLEVNAFDNTWNAGFVLFGIHLLVVGCLAYRSGYVPKLLGVLIVISGFGYAFDSFVAVLAAGSLPELSLLTWIGEFLLALWLLTRGRRLTVSESGTGTDPDRRRPMTT